MKSSLKFCVIAASEYDIYISEPRASEWDIAWDMLYYRTLVA